ncbi:thioredoxin-like protein [Pyrenochaeta sp. MPI-SDFR-AT-0127]|nr:thioredoxin-like protein [Pyrenochaeta sp. MPI-SDFR-AT-0127]
MDYLPYIIIAIIAIVIIGPALFADRSPIPETSGNVFKVSKPSELDSLLSSTTHVVVDFYADWCPPCRTIAPMFSKLADEHASKGQLAFAKVNVDHVNDVAKRYGISAMPTFLFFKDGKSTSVAVQKTKRGASTGATEDVEKVLGADVVLLRSVVRALAEKAQS